MIERPILFSAPMVRALLDGSKTQTRRIVAAQPENGWAFESPPVFGRITSPHPKKGKFGVFIRRGVGTDFPELDLIPCPYGMPGDRLWVRETYQPLWADGVWRESQTDWKTGAGYLVSYPATDGVQEFMDADDNLRTTCKPSIHMPRWASRILLEITSVRVERLQDIGSEDIAAEGVVTADADIMQHGCRARVMDWQRLWESINGAGNWEINPWVWVIEFRRAEP